MRLLYPRPHCRRPARHGAPPRADHDGSLRRSATACAHSGGCARPRRRESCGPKSSGCAGVAGLATGPRAQTRPGDCCFAAGWGACLGYKLQKGNLITREREQRVVVFGLSKCGGPLSQAHSALAGVPLGVAKSAESPRDSLRQLACAPSACSVWPARVGGPAPCFARCLPAAPW